MLVLHTQAISLSFCCSSSDCSLEREMEEDKPNTSHEAFSEAQMKAISAVVGGLLEKALKDHVGVPQLENVVGPPYLQNN